MVLVHGDARHLPLPDNSIDAVVCDPPYGLEFMGTEWDSFRPSSARLRTRVDGRTNPTAGKSTVTTPEAYVAGRPFQDWCQVWATECLRVLKPGGHLLAFGGTRTWHRLGCAIEDAGFDIRDTITWLYSTGFPKSHDVSKALDTPAGATDDARRWAGWGTALKPAHEPIVVARKPFPGTVAANVLAYGTGAVNLDACRVSAGQDYLDKCASAVGYTSNRTGDVYGDWTGVRGNSAHTAGRWPPNVVLSHPAGDTGDACADGCVEGCPVAALDAQSGTTSSVRNIRRVAGAVVGNGKTHGPMKLGQANVGGLDDRGGASRFFPTFRYQAKAPASERPRIDGVSHPTVKPLALMRWLCRLVTPPGGTVLDPFAGSGTTVEAAIREGFHPIGVEQNPRYLPLTQARINRSRLQSLTLPLSPMSDQDEEQLELFR